MIIHNFDPVLIDLGFLQIKWYSIAYILGITLGWAYALKIIKNNDHLNKNITLGDFDDLIVYIVIGIILGAFVLYGINAATADMTDFPYTNPTVPIPYVLGALVLMIILGTLIGLIPAQKAVSVKPIDALREE